MSVRALFPYQRHRFKHEDIMEDLPDEVVDELLKDQEVIPFARGEVVFREGVRPQGVYYIRQGRVKNYTRGYEGREYLFYISGEREIIGHHGLLNGETNAGSAAVLEDSILIFIPGNNFMQAYRKSRDFQVKLTRNLSHEFGVFVHLTKILAQYNVRERTALMLLIVNEKFLSGGSLDAVITLSREEMASMVGTAKENLVRVLREFREENIISTKGHGIIIRDFDALMHLSNYFELH